MLRKIKILKFALLILIPISLWSSYQTYLLVSYDIYKNKVKPKIVVRGSEDIIFTGEEFEINLLFQNIPNINLDEGVINKILHKIGGCATLKNYEIKQIDIQDFGSNNITSLSVEAKYVVSSDCESKQLNSINITNNDGQTFAIYGRLPQIKKFGSYDFVVTPNEIFPNDEFDIELKVYNVDQGLKFSKFHFDDFTVKNAPKAISNPIVTTSPGIKGKINYIIKQKFKSEAVGQYQLLGIELQDGQKIIRTSRYPIKVVSLNSSYDVSYSLPQEIDEVFSIKVELKNVFEKHIPPKFPDIPDCLKYEVKIDKEVVGAKTFNYTYIQEYRVKSDGQYAPSIVYVNLNGQQSISNIPAFNIYFDCSSPDVTRPANGFTKSFSMGKDRGSGRNVTITNDLYDDVYVKVINNRNQRAAQSIYIREKQKATVYDLPYGTYFLAFASGSHWDKKKSRFRCSQEFTVFNTYDDLMSFDGYASWTFTIYQITTSSYNAGPKNLSESQFDNY